jgi:hypothetical protein
METKEPIQRADDELRDMLDEPGTWVVHGHNRQVFGVAPRYGAYSTGQPDMRSRERW